MQGYGRPWTPPIAPVRPQEQTDEADALSRLEAEPPRGMSLLGDAVFVAPPEQDEQLWKARLDFSQEAVTPAVSKK